MKSILFLALMILAWNLNGQGKELPGNHQLTVFRGMTKNQVSLPDRNRKVLSTQQRVATIHPVSGQNKLLSASIALLDSTYSWTWDTLLHEWQYDYKSVDYTYDANNNITGTTDLIWDGTAWINDSKYIYAFDGNNNLTNEIIQIWTGAAWENYAQYLITYNASNLRTTFISKTWNGNDWENFDKTTYMYDAEKNLTLRLDQNWNITVWENFGQNIFMYDGDNNNTNELIQLWNGSDWENYTQYIYTYKEDHLLENGLTQYWNGASWDNLEYYTVLYDAQNIPTSEVHQYWTGSDWINSYQYTFEYDDHGNNTKYLAYSWVGSGWVKSYEFENNFDAQDYLVSGVSNYYNSTGTIIIGRDSLYNYYHMVTSVHHTGTHEADIVVYPNPSLGQCSISSATPQATIEIFNSAGQMIYIDSPFTEQHTCKVDVSDQPEGIYFVKIKDGTGIHIRKLILQ